MASEEFTSGSAAPGAPAESSSFGYRQTAVFNERPAPYNKGGQQSPQYSVGASVPVPAGRQVGFELLGWLLVTLIFGAVYFTGFIAATIVYSINVEGVAEDYGVGFLTAQGVLSPLFSGFMLLMVVLLVPVSWFMLAVLLAFSGRTPGGVLGGYRLVSPDGANVGFGKALAYYAVYYVALVIPFGGLLILLSPLFDTNSGWNRNWLHQMVAAAAVVKDRK